MFGVDKNKVSTHFWKYRFSKFSRTEEAASLTAHRGTYTQEKSDLLRGIPERQDSRIPSRAVGGI